jgi:hypothetical protein
VNQINVLPLLGTRLKVFGEVNDVLDSAHSLVMPNDWN